MRRFTQSRMYRFERKPWEYDHSEAQIRVLAMVTHLQRDLGLRYHPAKMPRESSVEPEDSFVYGAALGDGGTCGSIPVVVAAVGRRLGYPIKIVETKPYDGGGHLFARWDDPNGARFNIEANVGFAIQPDEYYRKAPFNCTKDEEQKFGFLRSMTPSEELAAFLGQRACFWRDYGKYRHEVKAMAWASVLNPNDYRWPNCLLATIHRWETELQKRVPPIFPKITVQFCDHLSWQMPADLVRLMYMMTAAENLLNDPHLEQEVWEPLRHGQRLRRIPVSAYAQFHHQGCNIRMEWNDSLTPKLPQPGGLNHV